MTNINDIINIWKKKATKKCEFTKLRVFLSHTWNPDEHNRNTHSRVCDISHLLRKHNIMPWLDEENMIHNVDKCMSSGIDSSDIVIMFITKKYCEKIEFAAQNPQCRDNCFKEFSYSLMSNKIILPVVFEECMKDLKNWPSGIVKMNLGSQLYIDGTSNCAHIVTNNIINAISKCRNVNRQVHRKAPVLKRKRLSRVSPGLIVKI